MTAADALKYAEKNGAKMVDFKFVDLLGIWQHTTMPVAKLTADVFKDGYFFDGSSIRGWQPIHASDMIFLPDAASAIMDPFYALPTLSLTCDIVDAVTHQPYSKDPRTIAAKAEKYLKSTGIADTAYFGPEPEFFIFDEVRFASRPTAPLLRRLGRGRLEHRPRGGPNLGYKSANKEGYFPVPPTDTLTDIRTEMVTVEAVGIEVERPPRGGDRRPGEIDVRFNSLVADGRQPVVQVRREERRPQARQDGDLHAQAAVRRQRLGHALPPVALEGRQEPLRRRRLRGPERDGAPLHRRHPQARAGVCCALTNPTHQQLQAAGAGVRGAGEPGLLDAQPVGVDPHPDLLGSSPKAKRLEFRCPDPSATRTWPSRPC